MTTKSSDFEDTFRGFISSELEKRFVNRENPPNLLSHYCGPLTNLRSILESRQLWMSTAHKLNDQQEIKFLIRKAGHVFNEFFKQRSDTYPDDEFGDLFEKRIKKNKDFYEAEAIGTFFASFSLVDESMGEAEDGRLSMWRAYGDDGRGAALQFDAQKIMAPKCGGPFLFGPVKYLTHEEAHARAEEIVRLASDFFALKGHSITRESAIEFADNLMLWFWNEALFTKHCGFREETEWRLVYLPLLDSNGEVRLLMVDETARPEDRKLKLDLSGTGPDEGWNLRDLLVSIGFGPQIELSSVDEPTLLKISELFGKGDMSGKLQFSEISYAPSTKT